MDSLRLSTGYWHLMIAAAWLTTRRLLFIRCDKAGGFRCIINHGTLIYFYPFFVTYLVRNFSKIGEVSSFFSHHRRKWKIARKIRNSGEKNGISEINSESRLNEMILVFFRLRRLLLHSSAGSFFSTTRESPLIEPAPVVARRSNLC